jgi:trans-aconitate 2-methyltransferase
VDDVWDPARYARFGEHRARPFIELLSRVGADAPAVVVDLGCGDGSLTRQLATRWPQARIIGVDSSAPMLDRARDLDDGSRVEWVEDQIESWCPDGPVDVLLTNAALQWVPTHRSLIPTWVDALAPGGWFAMQVPGNFAAPSHRLLREVAADSSRADELLAVLRRDDVVGEPAAYVSLLGDLGRTVDVWETTYLHVLDPEGQQLSPVLEWTMGTALRPVLAVLTDHAERADFLDRYAASLAIAYPRRPFGTMFSFRRIFAVAEKGSTP